MDEHSNAPGPRVLGTDRASIGGQEGEPLMGCRARSWREHLTIRSRVFLQAADRVVERSGGFHSVFVGDDWAQDHHDVEVQDETGRRLAKARLPEGISGIARLHSLVGRFLPEDGDAAGVKIGIETDRGPWVAALVASGYQVYAINPLQSARAREGQDVSGAKSDAGDAHVLADLVRTHCHQLRTVAGDSAGRRGQGPDPDAPEPDLGPNPPGAAAALQPAGVLPSRPGSLRRPRFPRGPG